MNSAQYIVLEPGSCSEVKRKETQCTQLMVPAAQQVVTVDAYRPAHVSQQAGWQEQQSKALMKLMPAATPHGLPQGCTQLAHKWM